jgi:hypothetical protein
MYCSAKGKGEGMSFNYSEQLDAIDASVYSGELLITHLDEFEEYLQRWQRAVDEQRELLKENYND